MTRRRDVFVSGLGSFSTAYNIVNVSLAMVSMAEVYAQSEGSKSLSASSMFVGMVAGQLGFGFVGDAVGLVRAFRLTMLLQVGGSVWVVEVGAIDLCVHGLFVPGTSQSLRNLNSTQTHTHTFHKTNKQTKNQVAGALWSALVFPPSVYTQLAVARFVLGIGAGGVYPLAAAVASNAATATAAATTARGGGKQCRSSDGAVALVFALQGVAFVSMNALATLLAYTMADNPQAIFRLLLGLGAAPGLLVLLVEALGDSRALAPPAGSAHDPQSVAAAGATGATRAVLRALRQPRAARRLVGCSLTWFLYDVCFFGNTLFQPSIGNAVFGGSGSLRTESKTSLLLALVALPGYFLSVALIDRLGPRYIQTQVGLGLGYQTERNHTYLCLSLSFFLNPLPIMHPPTSPPPRWSLTIPSPTHHSTYHSHHPGLRRLRAPLYPPRLRGGPPHRPRARRRGPPHLRGLVPLLQLRPRVRTHARMHACMQLRMCVCVSDYVNLPTLFYNQHTTKTAPPPTYIPPSSFRRRPRPPSTAWRPRPGRSVGPLLT